MSVVKTKQVKSSQVKPTLAETERGTNATKEKRFGGEREGERPAVCVCVCVRARVDVSPLRQPPDGSRFIFPTKIEDSPFPPSAAKTQTGRQTDVRTFFRCCGCC